MNQLLNLRVGEKYTIVRFGEMGFIHSFQFTLKQTKSEPYAQYPESILLVFQAKRKRYVQGLRFLPNDDYLVYEGWVDVNTEMFVSSSMSPTGFNCKQSLLSFDREYFNRAKASLSQAPLLEKITPCPQSDTASMMKKRLVRSSNSEGV